MEYRCWPLWSGMVLLCKARGVDPIARDTAVPFNGRHSDRFAAACEPLARTTTDGGRSALRTVPPVRAWIFGNPALSAYHFVGQSVR